MTSVNVHTKDIKGQGSTEKEHVENNSTVRTMLLGRGVKPEELSAAKDIKNIQRKLEKENNNRVYIE